VRESRPLRTIRQRTLAATVWSAVLLAARPAVGSDDAPPSDARRDALQVGVAFAAETVASAGDVCPLSGTAPCILGSGGGVAIRVGYRAGDPWYFGGAYEFSRHESSSQLRLAILQQLRAEGRYYFDYGDRATGFLAAGFGGHLYGSEWGAVTGGAVGMAGGGVELELSPTTVIGGAVLYRALVPRAFTDSAGLRRADGLLGFGLAHVIGLELTLEVRNPFPRF
jgi:hypothetical protein